MVKKNKKQVNTKSLTTVEGKLKVSREDFRKSIEKLINEGDVLINTNLLFSEAYRHWLYEIENCFRISFDHPEEYLQEYNGTSCCILTSDMDGEQLLHEDLTRILLFLDSVMDRIPNIPCGE